MTVQLEFLKSNPMWVTGFCEAEACFHVSFTKRPNRKIKVEVRPSFSITQLPQSKYLLLTLEKFFQCGSIRYSRKDGCYRYEVRSLSDLNDKIIPHFDTNILVSPKKDGFLLFKEVCTYMKENKDKNATTLKKIIDLAFLINSPTKRKITKAELLKLIAR